MGFCPNKRVGGQTWKLSNLSHKSDSQIFWFHPRKQVNFKPKIENGRSFAHTVWTNWTIICSNTNSLKLFCANSSLNSANFTDNVISRVYSWKFYLRPKNVLHKSHLCKLWQIPCLSQPQLAVKMYKNMICFGTVNDRDKTKWSNLWAFYAPENLKNC